MALPFFNAYRGSIGRFFQGDPTLKGYWQLDGNSLDNSGNGNNGTDTNVTYGPAYGKFGKGASFNGTNPNIISTAYASSNNSTWSFWIKTSNANTQGIFGPINGSGNYNDRFISINNSGILCARKDTISGGNAATTISSIADGKWHNIVVLWVNATPGCVQVYLDGSFASKDTQGNQFDPGNVGFNIGYTVSYSVANDWNNYPFTGNLDEIAIFSRVLSPAEISQYYQWAISQPRKTYYEVGGLLVPNTRRRLLISI